MHESVPDLPRFETERLALRERNAQDLDDLMALNGDPDVMKFLHPVEPAPARLEKLKARIAQRFAGGLGYWSVFAKAAPSVFLGYVGLIPINRVGPGVELTYRFRQMAQRQGYAREAVGTLIGHAFRTLDIDQIEIHTHPDNARSLQLAAHLGFGPAGTCEVDEGTWSRLILDYSTYRAGHALCRR